MDTMTITELLQDAIEKRDPARWVAQACRVLIRVVPEVYTDCHTTVRTATPTPIAPTGPNLARMAAYMTPHAAEPALRMSTYRPASIPAPDGQSGAFWGRLVDKLNGCQVILRPAWVMPKPSTLPQTLALLERIKYHADHWYAQGRRAHDYYPVLVDAAHTLRGIVETDLAGWIGPRTVGTTACIHAGEGTGCRVSPVVGRGLCRTCYQRWYRAQKEEATVM